MYIGPEIGHQLLDRRKRVGCFHAQIMPMVAFAALVVITNLPEA
jgi:hypothetical protein